MNKLDVLAARGEDTTLDNIIETSKNENLSNCFTCTHQHTDLLTCDAYPEGIPDETLRGYIPHHKPIPGDSGIYYQEKVVDNFKS